MPLTVRGLVSRADLRLELAHPLAGVRLTPGMIMLFGPRDSSELDTVLGIVRAGHAWASAEPSAA